MGEDKENAGLSDFDVGVDSSQDNLLSASAAGEGNSDDEPELSVRLPMYTALSSLGCQQRQCLAMLEWWMYFLQPGATHMTQASDAGVRFSAGGCPDRGDSSAFTSALFFSGDFSASLADTLQLKRTFSRASPSSRPRRISGCLL
jgi:hypothetical protein